MTFPWTSELCEPKNCVFSLISLWVAFPSLCNWVKSYLMIRRVMNHFLVVSQGSHSESGIKCLPYSFQEIDSGVVSAISYFSCAHNRCYKSVNMVNSESCMRLHYLYSKKVEQRIKWPHHGSSIFLVRKKEIQCGHQQVLPRTTRVPLACTEWSTPCGLRDHGRP